MIRMCAWCKTNQGEKEPLLDKSVTHGICSACSTNLLDKHKKVSDVVKLVGLEDEYKSVKRR